VGVFSRRSVRARLAAYASGEQQFLAPTMM